MQGNYHDKQLLPCSIDVNEMMTVLKADDDDDNDNDCYCTTTTTTTTILHLYNAISRV